VSALFWLVVRWIAAALIGVAVGSAALMLGFGSATLAVGAVAVLLGGGFVLASIVANNTSLLSGGISGEGADAELVGPGLLRATLLGFLGAGVVVGSVSGNEATFLIAAATGAIAVLLSLGAGRAEERRLW
jgi:hypothetical protein